MIYDDVTHKWKDLQNGTWVEVSLPPPSEVDETIRNSATGAGGAAALVIHSALPDAHHPANAGITGTKTLGGFKFTFTNGLLTGFEPA